jgi:hypothetical protein
MGGAAEFNPACPDGAYQLDLAAAADRAVAHQLAALDVASGQDLMRNVTLDGRNMGSCRKAGWPERLPTKGVLSCDFVSRRLKRDVPIIDGRKFNNLVKQVRGRGRGGRGPGVAWRGVAWRSWPEPLRERLLPAAPVSALELVPGMHQGSGQHVWSPSSDTPTSQHRP